MWHSSVPSSAALLSPTHPSASTAREQSWFVEQDLISAVDEDEFSWSQHRLLAVPSGRRDRAPGKSLGRSVPVWEQQATFRVRVRALRGRGVGGCWPRLRALCPLPLCPAVPGSCQRLCPSVPAGSPVWAQRPWQCRPDKLRSLLMCPGKVLISIN